MSAFLSKKYMFTILNGFNFRSIYKQCIIKQYNFQITSYNRNFKLGQLQFSQKKNHNYRLNQVH